MNSLTSAYQQRLQLENANFIRIDHDDAMVAIVYKVSCVGRDLILKICSRQGDYFREVYFLKFFANILPVPQILQVVPPEEGIDGAILMQYLPGQLLKTSDLTDAIAYEIGSLLARIHLNKAAGYGDIIEPNTLSQDPGAHFTLKFNEGFAECAEHLPTLLLEQAREFFDRNIKLLSNVDGPCIIHRDFRPGNILIHNGKVQGIIDWSSGRAGFAQEDFTSLEHGEWHANPASKKSFLSGYASIRPVPNYSAIMPLLRLSKAFGTIGFTVKRGTWNSKDARIYQYNRQFLDAFFENRNDMKN